MRSELEAEEAGLFVESSEEVLTVFVFVVVLAKVAVVLAFLEHAIDEARDLVSDGLDGFGRVESGA